MTAREGDEVLIRLLDRAKPLTQMRHRPFFEGDHRRHSRRLIRLKRLISY
jgi:hypothetical protein